MIYGNLKRCLNSPWKSKIQVSPSHGGGHYVWWQRLPSVRNSPINNFLGHLSFIIPQSKRTEGRSCQQTRRPPLCVSGTSISLFEGEFRCLSRFPWIAWSYCFVLFFFSYHFLSLLPIFLFSFVKETSVVSQCHTCLLCLWLCLLCLFSVFLHFEYADQRWWCLQFSWLLETSPSWRVPFWLSMQTSKELLFVAG